MARGGVTYTDIAKAAETIKSAGKNPTVDRVLNSLGTGSKSTIGPHLKTWKQKHSEQNEHIDLPLDLLQAVRDLHQRLNSQAEEKVKNSEQMVLTNKIQQAEEVNKLTSHIKSLAKTLNEIKENRDSLIADNENLIKELSEANLKKVKLETKNKSDTQRILELTTSKNEVIHQLKLAHDQQEHYQMNIAENRNLERIENLAIKEQLKTQIAEQSRQLLAADERETRNQKDNENLRKENINLSKVVQKISESLHTLEYDKAQKDTIITSMTTQAKQNSASIQQTNKKYQRLSNSTQSQSNQISALTSECTVLKEYLDIARQDLTTTQNRLESKIDQYQAIYQEKVVLETRLTSLQNSI